MLEKLHFVKGIDPVADAFAGTKYSDVVNMAKYNKAMFIVYKGVGTTGVSTITVQACDNTTPSNRTAIPFYYKEITSDDTQGALKAATTSGFSTTAGSSQIYAVEIDGRALASTGYGYVQLKMVESVDDPVLGGILIILGEPRYAEDVTPSAIS